LTTAVGGELDSNAEVTDVAAALPLLLLSVIRKRRSTTSPTPVKTHASSREDAQQREARTLASRTIRYYYILSTVLCYEDETL